ncbi:hypothetical protein CHU95_14085 [Niveispirillum lacus]|uniref:DUF2975 domain-containing protein n=1 Tax=Niveispirillum lacus TaxID=1981099 RepID=A0A255YYM2_9PROT|nr:DUF2975 domain-containing protein [Niveispirillum lacus]OYQ33520.1 hypothetical protein CHU95_14085 [Niveispirillum lacus]
MSLRVLNWILTTAIWLLAFGILLILGVTFYAGLTGKPWFMMVPVILSPAVSTDLLREGQAVVGHLLADRGTLNINIDQMSTKLLSGVSMAAAVGLCLYAAFTLRRLVGDIAGGDPFAATAVTRLRRIGWLLIGANAVTVAFGCLLPLLLSGASIADGRELVVNPFWSSLPDAPYAKVAPDINGWLALCGLVLLALAEAFRIGRDLKVEGEGII